MSKRKFDDSESVEDKVVLESARRTLGRLCDGLDQASIDEMRSLARQFRVTLTARNELEARAELCRLLKREFSALPQQPLFDYYSQVNRELAQARRERESRAGRAPSRILGKRRGGVDDAKELEAKRINR